jgi:hypothetical protein
MYRPKGHANAIVALRMLTGIQKLIIACCPCLELLRSNHRKAQIAESKSRRENNAGIDYEFHASPPYSRSHAQVKPNIAANAAKPTSNMTIHIATSS